MLDFLGLALSRPQVSSSQRFQFHTDGTITDGYGHCLSIDSTAHGVGANVAASNSSCVASKCAGANTCVQWTRGADGNLSHSQKGPAGPESCLDAGSGGSFSDGSDVRFEPAALAEASGPGQAYCNASAPSWGGAVIKIGKVYHMWVLTMRNCSDINDPNTGNPFVNTGRIDHATSTSPT